LLAVSRGFQDIFNASRNPSEHGCVLLIAPEHGGSSLTARCEYIGKRRAAFRSDWRIGAASIS